MSAFTETLKFYLGVLKNLKPYHEGKEAVMITVRLRNSDSFCPPLFQIIKEEKGYLLQSFEEETHKVIFSKIVSEDLLEEAVSKVSGVAIDLTWGPYLLMEFEM